MGSEQQQNELSDVALCYQAMGVQLDASPVEIDSLYKSLTEGYKKKLEHPDPLLRQEARKSLDQLEEMYQKIRNSISYHAAQKDYLKKNAADAGAVIRPARPLHHSVARQSLMMHCPRCNGSINKGLKFCPICKSPIYTVLEKLQRAYLTPKQLVIYCVLASVISLTVYGALHPDRLSGLPGFSRFFEAKPDMDFPELKEK